MKTKITTVINVNENNISILRNNEEDYISLTDIARLKNVNNPSDVVKKWMSNHDTIEFVGLWEELFNEKFNSAEFRLIKNDSPKKSFIMTPNQWVKRTNSIGIVADKGKYSKGTYANIDIALEFSSWIDTKFKLYLIKEFQRLKKDEAYQKRTEWNVRRIIAKGNYRIHTDAIKDMLILPILTKEQINYTYSNEADVLNVAMFGMTAKEWRIKNPDLKGNIRDYATIEQLIVLSNMESSNSIMKRDNISQYERLKKLNEYALIQLKSLQNNASVNKIKDIDIKVL